MKKNGFTLVELLAIIIVIGILVTITGPYVIRSIQTSRKSAFKNSAEGIIRVIQNEANENNYEEMNYTISDGTITDQNGNTLKTAGGNGETGEAYLDTSGRVSLAIQNKDKDLCARKGLKETHITITEKQNDCTMTDTNKDS